jgi:hypothetical protein
MLSTKTKNYTIITPNKSTVSEFLEELNLNATKLKDENLIIDISEFFNTNSLNLNVFLPLSEKHKKNGTSFVLVFKDSFEDDLLDKLDIVTTLTEAKDIVEMDAISRDLGF